MSINFFIHHERFCILQYFSVLLCKRMAFRSQINDFLLSVVEQTICHEFVPDWLRRDLYYAGLDGDYKCQLSVKISAICQLSVKF